MCAVFCLLNLFLNLGISLSVAGEPGLHPAGRAFSALCGAGCAGLCRNVAEKRALIGQPGTLHSLDVQGIVCILYALCCYFLFIN